MSIITASWFLWFLFMIPPFIFMIYAQVKVNSAFRKYSKVANMHRITGAQAAEVLLKDSGLDNVRVERIGRKLGDHYDPRHKVLRLLWLRWALWLMKSGMPFKIKPGMPF
jgi:hypothetical protein